MKHRGKIWLGLGMLVLVLASATMPVIAAEEGAKKLGRPEGLVPYVPTPYDVVEEMLKMADVKTSDVVFDLGCGDGRIVVMAAKKFGAKKCVGVDINPERVKEARELAKKEGVEDRVTIVQEDLAVTNFSTATVVTLYLLPEYNRALRPKLERLLPLGARVVSHDFDMPPIWKPVQVKEFADKDGGHHTLYLWVINEEMKKRVAEEKAKAAAARKAAGGTKKGTGGTKTGGTKQAK